MRKCSQGGKREDLREETMCFVAAGKKMRLVQFLFQLLLLLFLPANLHNTIPRLLVVVDFESSFSIW